MSRQEKHAAFIGAGLIGTGLATCALTHGQDTVLQDISPEAAEKSKDRIREALQFLIDTEVITEEDKETALSRLTVTTDLEEAVAHAFFIQESGPERLDIKQSVIADIEALAPADAVIASSTSSQLITNIFAEAKHPERGVGGHPYHPAYLVPLMEVTRGERTSEETLETARNFYSSIGKVPVTLQKEVVGFIANRFQSCIHRELVQLVMDGVCSVEDADKALVYSVGMRWGIIGQAMALHLGAAPEGLAGFTKKYHMEPGVVNKRMDALATWNVFPDNWDQILYRGVEEEIAHRPEETGKDMASIERWRDEMLVRMLKLHKVI